MKFTISAIFALVAVVSAFSQGDQNAYLRSRQAAAQNQVDASVPAMSDKNGNVVPFDAANVYQDALAKGI
ncbi:hypothetical protein B0T22DRAFT_481014 [Podospora appendiculata]|uniref:Uncharacterized protein n=1 Tax=Podospora appendiculata TaxID=314037 RepID=A0AAE1CDS1_9PEZI|nr:hypothetical protein B0T22DRAFT_481014 [Podospora appendiculata]